MLHCVYPFLIPPEEIMGLLKMGGFYGVVAVGMPQSQYSFHVFIF
jgi:hypothetical protein